MGSWMSQAIKTFIGSPLQHLNQAVNTSDLGETLNLPRSSVELKQFIIRLPPTMEVACLLIFQLVFNAVGFKLLNGIGDPVGVLCNPF